jgi:hypothetical protein
LFQEVNSERITGKPEVNCRYQAISQVCAFPSPFGATMSEMAMFRQLEQKVISGHPALKP